MEKLENFYIKCHLLGKPEKNVAKRLVLFDSSLCLNEALYRLQTFGVMKIKDECNFSESFEIFLVLKVAARGAQSCSFF